MRNTISSLLTLCAVLLTLWGIGCGGGDGGTDPQPEACSLTVLAPLTGNSFESGETANIRWEETGDAASVAIELRQGGSAVGTLTAGTENDGFFPWSADVMGGTGGDFTVRLSAVGESGCTAESGLFTIANTAACNLTQTTAIPRSDTLTAGDVQSITWQSHDTLGDVGIELLYGADEFLVGTIARETPDDGEFDWTVHSFNDAAHRTVYDPSRYWLRVFAEDVPGCEDRTIDFTLVDDDICAADVWILNRENAYAVGDTVEIGYSVSDWSTGETVKLRLYTGDILVPNGYITMPGEDISAEGTNSYTWVVDDFGAVGGNLFRVRVIKSNDEYCWGKTDAFAIHD